MNDPIAHVLDHWFGVDPATTKDADTLFERWFRGGATVDRDIETRFGGTARAAAEGRLDHWANSARGRLALILLLDQVPRHLYRGHAAAFEQDDRALALASSGINDGMDKQLPVLQRAFFYMPLQHAESSDAQTLAVRMFDALVASDVAAPIEPLVRRFAEYAQMHRDIIVRFGRFPHRNSQLGREHTAEERQFLQDGGPSFGQ